MATPVLRALRRALPGTRIVWAGRGPTLDLVDGLADADETFRVDARATRGIRTARASGRAWRDAKTDAVLVLPNSWSSGLEAWFSRAPVRVGYARRGRGFLLTRRLSQPRDERGDLDPEPMRARYLRLAALFGAEDDGLPPRLVVSAPGKDLAEERLRGAGVAGPFLGVSPGAAFGDSKIYPPARMAEAASRAIEATGLPALVLCAPGEETLARETASKIRGRVVSTDADPARWPEAKALIAKCACVLTPDAGPRHVAVALGVPVVAILGPTDPGWTKGDEATTTVVRKEGLSCLGCHEKRCPIPGHPCMETLEPATVADAVIARLAAARSGGG
jgi:heptosyltransferase-2